MAAYVKLFRSIWTDPDFVALPAAAQRLYLVLISQPDLSPAGILPLTAGRWSALAPDTGIVEVKTHLERLADARFVIIDARTDEVLVRAYVARDEAWRIPNGLKSIAAAVDRVISEQLRNTIITTLATLGVTLPSTLAPTHPPRDTSPQQNSAVSHQPSAGSRQATAPVDNSAPVDTTPPAAAADITIIDTVCATIADHRIATERPRKVTPYRRTLLANLPTEYGTAILAHHAAHPTHDPATIAQAIGAIPTPTPAAPPPDPTATRRAGANLGTAIATAQLANGEVDQAAARAEIGTDHDARFIAAAWEAYDDTIAATLPTNVTPIGRRTAPPAATAPTDAPPIFDATLRT